MSGDVPEEQLPGQIVPVDQRLPTKVPFTTTSVKPELDICLRDYKCIQRIPTDGFAEQNGRDAMRADEPVVIGKIHTVSCLGILN